METNILLLKKVEECTEWLRDRHFLKKKDSHHWFIHVWTNFFSEEIRSDLSCHSILCVCVCVCVFVPI